MSKIIFLFVLLALVACSGEYDSTGYLNATPPPTPTAAAGPIEVFPAVTLDTVNLNSENIRAVSTLIPHPNPDRALDGESTVIPRPYNGWEQTGVVTEIVHINKHVCDGIDECRWCGQSIDGQYFLMGTPGPEKMPENLMYMCR